MVDATGVWGTGISMANQARDVDAALICDTARCSRTAVGDRAAADGWIADPHAFVEGEQPAFG